MANKVAQFYREVVAELKKVTWPSRDELKGATIVVLVLTGLLAVYIGVIDFIVSRVITLLIK